MTRRRVDWENIEEEYRAGQLPIREIARRYEIDPSQIHRRAKKYSWERDLSDKIRRAVRTKVSSPVTVTNDTTREMLTDDEIIEAASERGRLVVEGHLSRAQRLKTMADRMSDGLEAHFRNEDPGFEIFVAKGDGPASVLKILTDVTEKIVNLERKSLNLDEKETQDNRVQMVLDFRRV